jgi:hypothetical protein
MGTPCEYYFSGTSRQVNSFLPKGLELDLLNGKAYISLVAFQFNDIRIKGFAIPYHKNFPEINLRFYVKRNNNRGVVFIREFVPKYMVEVVARLLYNEPYSKAHMESSVSYSGNRIQTSHLLEWNHRVFNVSVEAENKPFVPDPTSIEHFLKEQIKGFGQSKSGKLISYDVEHPTWEIFPVKTCHSDVDFNWLYGKPWEFLNNEKPVSVMFAKGSEIKLGNKQLLS